MDTFKVTDGTAEYEARWVSNPNQAHFEDGRFEIKVEGQWHLATEGPAYQYTIKNLPGKQFTNTTAPARSKPNK